MINDSIIFSLDSLSFEVSYLAINSTDNKKDFIQKIKKLPLGFFSKTRSGELINTFTGDFLAIEPTQIGRASCRERV